MQTINLLPQQYVKQEKSKTFKIMIGLAIAIELGVTGLAALSPIKIIQDKKQYLEHIQERLQDVRFNEVKAMQIALEQEQESYETWSNHLKEMKTSYFISGNLLDTLLGNIPMGVSIDQLNIQEQMKCVQIEGKTVSVFALMGYITKLEGIYEDAQIQFDLGEINLDKGYNAFEMKIHWGNPIGEQGIIGNVEDGQDE